MSRRQGRTSNQSETPESSRPASTGPDGEENTPPFFNTTFSTHRVSPLFVGTQELTPARLEQLAFRLRDTLVGDVVRGIQIGLEATDTPAGQVGPLRSIKLRWFRASELLGDEGARQTPRSRARSPATQRQGLWIEIRHENAAYVALLLPGFSAGTASGNRNAPVWTTQQGVGTEQLGEVDQSQFVHLPLMLLRMPLPLKSIISDWLATTFDCRVSKLALGTRTLVNAWESWIQETGIPSKGPDLAITLAFHTPEAQGNKRAESDSEDELNKEDEPTEPGLRSMEITIAARDLRRFVREGESLGPERRRLAQSWESDLRERRRLAGGNADDGWAWRKGAGTADQPFTEALARYLDHHLALNMFHPSVRVVQVSCGGFVLAPSRMKILRLGDMTDELSRAAWTFVTLLGDRISGEALPSVF